MEGEEEHHDPCWGEGEVTHDHDHFPGFFCLEEEVEHTWKLLAAGD